MRWIQTDGSIIECSVEEYAQISKQPKETKEYTEKPIKIQKGSHWWTDAEREIIKNNTLAQAHKLLPYRTIKAIEMERYKIIKRAKENRTEIPTMIKTRKKRTLSPDDPRIEYSRKRMKYIKSRLATLIREYGYTYEQAFRYASNEYKRDMNNTKDTVTTYLENKTIETPTLSIITSPQEMDDLLIMMKNCLEIKKTIDIGDIWWKKITNDEWVTFCAEVIINKQRLMKILKIEGNIIYDVAHKILRRQ